jgi:hypothetical protein
MMERRPSENSSHRLNVIGLAVVSVLVPSTRPLRLFDRNRSRNTAGPKLWLPLIALLAAGCSTVSFVDEITFVNQTDYPAHVEVSDASRQGWLNLTIAQRDVETTVRDVIDQGEVWVFRFDYAGQHEEEIEISRSELIRAEWKIEVPQSFGEALQRLGIEPPPP